MRASFASLVLLLILAGCAAPAPERPQVLRARAAFTGPEAEVVEVLVYEIPPGTVIQQVVLAGPDGQVLAAPALSRATSESGPGVISGPSIGVGVSGGSSSGVNPSLSLGWFLFGGGPGFKSDQIAARIALPDPAAYRETARAWRVEVRHLDVTGEARVLTLLAPVTGR